MTLLEPEIIPIRRADITGDGAWWCNGCGDFGVDAAIKQVIPVSYTHLTLPTILRV